MIDGYRLGVVKEVHVLCLGREDVDAFAKNRTVLDSSSTQRASMKNLFTSPDEVSKEEEKKDDDDDDDDKDEGKKSTFLRAAKHLNNMNLQAFLPMDLLRAPGSRGAILYPWI